MKILLSIKPEFAERILSGEKRYEFRKALFKRPDVSTIVIYATRPVGRIVGEFDIADVLTDAPETLWKKTAHAAGISKDFFDSYFEGRKRGYAIAVGDVRRFGDPIRPETLIDDFTPPQSYQYISDTFGRVVERSDSDRRQLAMRL